VKAAVVAAVLAAITLIAYLAGPGEPTGPSYTTCYDAWMADHAPLHSGQPGYSQQLDRDGDGTACETREGAP
jgi:hypothetical protein